MKPIPREEAQKLLLNLQEAHYLAAMNNNNLSKHVTLQTFAGSQNPMHSIAAGLLSTGMVHGPLTETRNCLEFFTNSRENFIQIQANSVMRGGMYPGLGNSFFSEGIDPSFITVYENYIRLCIDTGNHNSDEKTVLEDYVETGNILIKEYKKKPIYLYPNAASITSAICELTGGLPFIENWFFIAGRSRAWLEIMGNEEKSKYTK